MRQLIWNYLYSTNLVCDKRKLLRCESDQHGCCKGGGSALLGSVEQHRALKARVSLKES